MRMWSVVQKRIRSMMKGKKRDSKASADLVAALVKRREELGWSQRDLAQKTGIRRVSIARLESLKAIPRVKTLEKLSRSLGMTIKLELLSEDK